MTNLLADLFRIEKKPKRGLLAFEWVVLAYMVFTLTIVFFAYTKLTNPEEMIWGRIRVAVMTVAMWLIYKLAPCKLTLLARVLLQLGLLAWWYPDTYDINRIFPNLDYMFAEWEQQLFGFQPALVFASTFSSPIVSELMDLGYASYYPMIVFVAFFFFFYRYKDFECCAFVILASFFTYYVIFDLLPVVGPTFYYKAVGTDKIAGGIFPALRHYFDIHQDCLPSPGYTNGLFYNLVESAKAAGERPTAAFPSSHVGISTVCMLLVWHARGHKLLLLLLPFYVLLFFSTVYIQAHYAIDAIAGVLTGALFYLGFMYIHHRYST